MSQRSAMQPGPDFETMSFEKILSQFGWVEVRMGKGKEISLTAGVDRSFDLQALYGSGSSKKSQKLFPRMGWGRGMVERRQKPENAGDVSGAALKGVRSELGHGEPFRSTPCSPVNQWRDEPGMPDKHSAGAGGAQQTLMTRERQKVEIPGIDFDRNHAGGLTGIDQDGNFPRRLFDLAQWLDEPVDITLMIDDDQACLGCHDLTNPFDLNKAVLACGKSVEANTAFLLQGGQWPNHGIVLEGRDQHVASIAQQTLQDEIETGRGIGSKGKTLGFTDSEKSGNAISRGFNGAADFECPRIGTSSIGPPDLIEVSGDGPGHFGRLRKRGRGVVVVEIPAHRILHQGAKTVPAEAMVCMMSYILETRPTFRAGFNAK